MKDKYTKLLLGEDMSGGGKGVCSAVAISNAITNLFGKLLLFLVVFKRSFIHFSAKLKPKHQRYRRWNEYALDEIRGRIIVWSDTWN